MGAQTGKCREGVVVMSPNQTAILAYAAARSARVLFPEWFSEKTDQEIIIEIAAAVQLAGEKVPE